ncbi:hypothetical protein [Streptomyces coeruleorubidus]|uniref:hypothetical protein n=1 Tax=Streptomyces coeruleorubidus TaxID=116188 RepID=UPI003695F1EA
MRSRGQIRNALRAAGVLAAGAALAVAIPGSAHAGGGKFTAHTRDSKVCGDALGYYYYYEAAAAQGKKFYDTNWDFDVDDYCRDGKGVSLYTKYSKWDSANQRWDYSHLNKYNRISSAGQGHFVADVRIFVCIVGVPSSCGEIQGI